jgi:hypothetical protein
VSEEMKREKRQLVLGEMKKEYDNKESTYAPTDLDLKQIIFSCLFPIAPMDDVESTTHGQVNSR